MHTCKTQLKIQVAIQDAWSKLRFYEEVEKEPPLLLKMTLAHPLRIVGDHFVAGNISRCEYKDGQFILKRITAANDRDLLAFEVIESSSRFNRHIKLRGGVIQLTAVDEMNTTISMTTYYAGHGIYFYLLQPFINFTIKSLHRFVIRDIEEAACVDLPFIKMKRNCLF